MKRKPASAKIWELFRKLKALEERGVVGERDYGQRLPGRSNSPKKTRKKRTVSASKAPDIQAHPYSIAVRLGKQIRFSASLEQLTAELEAVAPKFLNQ